LLLKPEKARLQQNSTLNALIDNCIKERKNDKSKKAITALKATALKEEKSKNKKDKRKIIKSI
jgi:hypothetical protein